MNKTKQTIYVDMDGVIADLHNGLRKALGKSLCGTFAYTTVDSMWEKIWEETGTNWIEFASKVDPSFWAELPVIESGLYMLHVLDEMYDVRILTNAHDGVSAHGKWMWVEKHAPQFTAEKRIIFCKEKWRLAKHGDVLIDDWSIQLDPWIRNNGVGIQYKGESVDKVLITLESLCLTGSR